MNRIGLALSGGGFRASLYHLGLIRFLRDAGILSQVSQITSVSGGSIVAAHLVLNWERYNGSPSEFDAAADEVLAFVRMDVRNRIIRRFPLTLPLRWPRRAFGLSNRRLTRTGLLEYHYERFLYGDTSLFELPDRPQLHILATNLSEGCLCAFHRDGLFMVRRQPNGAMRIDRVHVGLATVPMAVTASSAFPGFFPPLELSAADVGAKAGEFDRQAYTDGGVFDNLGVRMFRVLERPLLAKTPLHRDDFVDFAATVEALQHASASGEETPLRRLGQLMVATGSRQASRLLPGVAISSEGAPAAATPPHGANGDPEQFMSSCLWDVMRHHQFDHEPLFAGVRPIDPEAEALLKSSRLSGDHLDASDRVWLNRHLIEAAFRQATGRPCFRRLDSALDAVLVSDVGKQFEIKNYRRAGGLLQTSMRATDIVMDRVWQLEIETFRDAPGFLFAPVTDVVAPAEDPTALHPEIQRQVAHIRTDLDRFSDLEISALVRHGYCVARKACRARPDLFGAELPVNAPWDPVPAQDGASAPAAMQDARSRAPRPYRDKEPAPATTDARKLQASAFRRVWSTMLYWRDWVSYVYVPIIIPLVVVLPYFTMKAYQRSHRLSELVESLSQGSRDLEVMTGLLEGPVDPFPGEPAEEVHEPLAHDYAGFDVLQDSRILDLRTWNPSADGKQDSNSLVYGYRRLKVLKRKDNRDNDVFCMNALASSAQTHFRFPQQELQPTLRMTRLENSTPEKECLWQVSWDLRTVPPDEHVDLIYEHYSPALFLRRGHDSSSLSIPIEADAAEVTRWILMPEGKAYKNFRILRYVTGHPETSELVRVVTRYMASDSTILAYKLNSAQAGYTYEVTWYYD